MDVSVQSGGFSASASASDSDAGLWNDNIDDWFFEQLMVRTAEPVTTAGPPNCADRPWWWGKTETGVQMERLKQC
jgi:hypothetical protein